MLMGNHKGQANIERQSQQAVLMSQIILRMLDHQIYLINVNILNITYNM